MSKRSENIVKRTAAELRARRQRGETNVDWKAATMKPLPSGSDPDDAMEEKTVLTFTGCYHSHQLHTHMPINHLVYHFRPGELCGENHKY